MKLKMFCNKVDQNGTKSERHNEHVQLEPVQPLSQNPKGAQARGEHGDPINDLWGEPPLPGRAPSEHVTPHYSASLAVTIRNPAMWDCFEPGKLYMVTVEPYEEPEETKSEEKSDQIPHLG